ncbi:MAG: SRPBCC family protein [Candidatus Dormibacteraeota bacterium]|nr:SRPBCC family protein [Candidatus Dormibacteraeota bacterium]
MPSLHGKVSIAAPAERVWRAVLEDLPGMPGWARYLKSARSEDGGAPGVGKKIRLVIDAPGDISLVMLPEVWDRPRRASGRWVDGPVSGTWSYDFATTDAETDLTYEMDVRLGGMLRFASGMIQGRLDSGIQDAMRRLKEQLERPGGGPDTAVS